MGFVYGTLCAFAPLLFACLIYFYDINYFFFLLLFFALFILLYYIFLIYDCYFLMMLKRSKRHLLFRVSTSCKFRPLKMVKG